MNERLHEWARDGIFIFYCKNTVVPTTIKARTRGEATLTNVMIVSVEASGQQQQLLDKQYL
jgi:hypothetical protein